MTLASGAEVADRLSLVMGVADQVRRVANVTAPQLFVRLVSTPRQAHGSELCLRAVLAAPPPARAPAMGRAESPRADAAPAPRGSLARALCAPSYKPCFGAEHPFHGVQTKPVSRPSEVLCWTLCVRVGTLRREADEGAEKNCALTRGLWRTRGGLASNGAGTPREDSGGTSGALRHSANLPKPSPRPKFNFTRADSWRRGVQTFRLGREVAVRGWGRHADTWTGATAPTFKGTPTSSSVRNASLSDSVGRPFPSDYGHLASASGVQLDNRPLNFPGFRPFFGPDLSISAAIGSPPDQTGSGEPQKRLNLRRRGQSTRRQVSPAQKALSWAFWRVFSLPNRNSFRSNARAPEGLESLATEGLHRPT